MRAKPKAVRANAARHRRLRTSLIPRFRRAYTGGGSATSACELPR
jgi:hypothetical protein